MKGKKILTIIGNIISWPFDHIVEIVIVSFIMGLITTLQLRFFDIPKRYSDKIWFSNIVLAFVIYFVLKKLNDTGREKKDR
jgi:large-conductance mechanosensitive channel